MQNLISTQQRPSLDEFEGMMDAEGYVTATVQVPADVLLGGIDTLHEFVSDKLLPDGGKAMELVDTQYTVVDSDQERDGEYIDGTVYIEVFAMVQEDCFDGPDDDVTNNWHRLSTLRCPGCKADLLLHHAVTIKTNGEHGHVWEAKSHVDHEGFIQDTLSIMADGHYDGVKCSGCGRDLTPDEIYEEEDELAPRLDITACPVCHANLTEPDSVYLHSDTHPRVQSSKSELDDDGIVMPDLEDMVEQGLVDRIGCGGCGCFLDDHRLA